MKTFPGSSEQTALPPLSAAEPLPVATKDKLAALATDDPLPPPRARDRIRLLVQSPHRLFLYWNFRDNPFATLMRTFGTRAAQFQFCVRLLDLSEGTTSFAPASLDTTGRAGEYWFAVRPGTRYAAQIGFLGNNVFTRLLASNAVQTPRLTISPLRDETPKFRGSATEFERVLTEAGYERDALAVRFEAADEVAGGGISRGAAREFADAVDFAAADEQTLRTLLLALAMNESLDNLNVPRELRAQLAALTAHDIAVLRRRIAATLATDFEALEVFMSEEFHFNVWSSHSIGGSRVRQPPARRRRMWLPSLDHELLATIKASRESASTASESL